MSGENLRTASEPSSQPSSFFGPPNLVELLQHRVRCQPDDVAFTFLVNGEDEEISMTYRDLDRRARAIGAWLELSNLSGRRALLCYPPGLDFIAAFFGCMYAKVVAVPVYPPRRNQLLQRILAIAHSADAQVALTTDTVLRRIEPLTRQNEALSDLTWLPTCHIDSRVEGLWQPPEVNHKTLAFLQFTSGSTGTPKGVMLTHGNLIHNSALISHMFEHTRSCMGVFWLPSFHDMGLIGGILQPLYAGRANVMMSPMAFLQKPFRWLSAISRFGATTSGGPNFAYDLCVRRITPEQRETLDLSSWYLAFNGAEPVRAETIDRFCEAFEPCGFRREAFFPCYGLAEATLMVSGGTVKKPPTIQSFDADALAQGRAVPSDDAGTRRLVACGGALPDENVVVVDPEKMSVCADGQVGEIWVTGPSVAQGYWKEPAATGETFGACLADTGEGPFLRTGDLGFFRQGELFVTGRIKDLIIVHGVNHYPHDIELTVEASHEQLRPGCGAVFAIQRNEEELKIVVVQEVERRTKNDLTSILAGIRRTVWDSHELVVDAIVLIRAHSIPKTSSGKIQRHACHDAYLKGTLKVVEKWESEELAAESESDDETTDAVQGDGKPEDHVATTPPADGSGEASGEISPATFDLVITEIRKVAGPKAKAVPLDASIADLGLDSLQRMEIAASLEEIHGARFPEHVLVELETPRQLAVAVQHYLGTVTRRGSILPEGEEIPEEYYSVEAFPEYVRLSSNLRTAEAVGLENPFYHVNDGIASARTMVNGVEVINYASFNYLALSGHPEVTRAAKEALDRYGTSASASRLVSGHKPIHVELETMIARMLGAESALVFASGHATNESVIGHLFGPGDLVLHDAYAHNSIVQGATLSGARKRSFAHNDWCDADAILTECRRRYRRVVIALEGVYSMDGDFSDLPRFVELKKRHKTMLYVDEAHSIGTLGGTGRGIGEHFGVAPADVDIWMGTLSKTLASCGGYVAGGNSLIELLRYTTPAIIFGAAMAPAAAAAAIAALRLMLAEPERVACLRERAALFARLTRAAGMNIGSSEGTPVVPVILGNSLHCMAASTALLQRGINARPILHPAVEENAARLRFFIGTDHSEADIRRTIDVLTTVLAEIDPAHLAHGV